MNFTILIGRITKVPELNEVQANGKPTSVTKNTIAVKRPFKNSNDEYESDFFDFTLWGSTADFLVNYADKGSAIVLKGRIQNRKYQDQFGNNKQVTEIIGETVELLSQPKAKEQPKPKVEEKTPQDFNVDPFKEYEKTVDNELNNKVSEDDLPF